MPDLALNNWCRQLTKREALTLLILIIFIFIFCESILFTRLIAQRHFDLALSYLDKARATSIGLIAQKSFFYRKALKLLGSSSKLNPSDPEAYFEYAEAIIEIGDDPQLSNLLEEKILVGRQEERMGLYDLAKIKYTQAILKEPANAIYHRRLGALYDKLSNFSRAEEEFKNAILLAPQDVLLRIYVANYYLSKDKEAEFAVHLAKIIELYSAVKRENTGNAIKGFFKSIGREDLL